MMGHEGSHYIITSPSMNQAQDLKATQAIQPTHFLTASHPRAVLMILIFEVPPNISPSFFQL